MTTFWIRFIYLAITLLFLSNNGALTQVNAVVKIDTNLSKNQKEALIILPGFGDSKKGQKKQIAFFENQGFDIYIPDYKDRKEVGRCVANFSEFYAQENLDQYSKVHVFAYLIGAWTINTFIEENGTQNICTIIYDRSPIQERAPYIAVRYLHHISRLKFGPVLEDFLNTPYPAMHHDELDVGIIIENKATKFMRLYKKKTLKMGDLQWQTDALNQPSDDYFHTWLNHDQMYERFDVVGEEILHFLRQGKFTSSAQKEPFDWDPFVSYKKEGLK